jgi:hypothetical protein
MQHSPGGRRDQRVGCRFFPVHVLWLRHALMALDSCELGKTAEIGFVTPDFERRRVHRIAATLDPRAVAVPLAAMHYHFVTDLDVGNVLADGVNDAGSIAATDVEVLGFATLVASGDDVHRDTQCRPDVVVVDSRCHDIHQHFVIGDRRGIDDFLLKRLGWLAKALRTDQPGIHFLRNFAQRRSVAYCIELRTHKHAPIWLSCSMIFPR